MKFRSDRQRKKVMALMRKYGKLPKTIVPSKHMIGESEYKYDKRLRALKSGKRISETGKTYYEHRRNHSDKNPAKHI
jgi:hypothetical protein